MAELFQRIRTQINTIIQSLDRKMKIRLAVGGLFVVILVVVILFITRPDYVPLASDIDFADMNAIVTKLDELGIGYQAEGNVVLVDVKNLTKAKMAMAVDLNISQPDYTWTDVFANTSFTMTSEVREHQIMQAKTSTLSSGIENLEGVERATVELYIAPDSSFLLNDKKESSVSVMLQLEDGFQFSQQQISGIVSYVMNAVQGLPKENITIIDSTGQTLNKFSEDTDAFIASSNFEQTMIVENQLKDKLNNFLGAIYGRTHVRVAASVALDFDEYESSSTAFSPPIEGLTEGMIRSMTTLTESVTNGGTASGVPGTDSNVTATDYPSGADSGSSIESASKTVNYEMNEIVEVLSKAKGSIKDVTISILIDTTALEGNLLSEEHKQEVINLVTSAAGLETRSVSVVALKFAEDEMGLVKYSSEESDMGPGLPLWLVGVILGALLLGVVIFFLFSRNKANKIKEAEIAAIQAIEAEKHQNELEEIRTDIEDKSSPKYQIEKFIDAKPEAVAALLRSWMSEV